ncbi:hypothetical protein B0H10DRAFT_2207215 [Mycena sp. CBHHK59/15]|nr:hypothetical protein B0H10DRAFT_2207215 [Mycena sp. CBHHK59/15]
MPSLLNVAAQPMAADICVQPHYLGLSASRSVVPMPLDLTMSGVTLPRPRTADHRGFQSALPRLAPRVYPWSTHLSLSLPF